MQSGFGGQNKTKQQQEHHLLSGASINGGTSHAWSLQKCFYRDNSLEMQGQLDSTVSFLSPFPGETEFHIIIGCPDSFFSINNINGL
jgi:hypothetical protein